MKKKYVMSVLSGVSLTALTLTGCSTSNNAHSATSASSNRALVINPGGSGDFQDNFNPYSAVGNSGTQGILYECLVYFDPTAGKQFPLLAKSYSWSNDNKTLTVQLRNGTKWSDGKPFTSSDVVFTYNMIKKYPAADTSAVWQQLSSVSAKGTDAVVFQFKQANIPFLQYALGIPIVPAHIWSSLGDPTKAIIKNPIGTGPYTLKSFTTQDYKFQANLKYWGGVPAVKTLDFPAMNGNDAGVMSLAKGQVDWAGIFIPELQSMYVNKSSKYNHYWNPPSGITALALNLQNPMLSQLAVRQAISYGVDRTKIALDGEYGQVAAANNTGLILPNNQSNLDPSIPKSSLYTAYNPAKAMSILEKAGFKKNAQGIFEKDGKELNFTLQVVAGWTDWDTDCALIESSLKNVGIQVTVEQDQYGAYAANVAVGAKKAYDMAIIGATAGSTPFTLYQNLLNSNGSSNVEGLNNPSIDATLNDYAETTVANKQTQDMYKIENFVVSDLPILPLAYGDSTAEYRDQYFTGFPTASNPYVSPAPYTPYAQEIVLMHLKPVN